MSTDTLYRTPTWVAKRSHEQVKDDLRTALAAVGGTRLSKDAYDRHRREGALTGMRVTQRFGSWSAACLAADIEPNDPGRTYTRAWDAEALWARVEAYLADPDATGSYADFDAWSRLNPGPSAQTVRNVLGTWNEIKGQFVSR